MNFKNKIAQIGLTKIFLTFLVVFATITFTSTKSGNVVQKW